MFLCQNNDYNTFIQINLKYILHGLFSFIRLITFLIYSFSRSWIWRKNSFYDVRSMLRFRNVFHNITGRGCDFVCHEFTSYNAPLGMKISLNHLVLYRWSIPNVTLQYKDVPLRKGAQLRLRILHRGIHSWYIIDLIGR